MREVTISRQLFVLFVVTVVTVSLFSGVGAAQEGVGGTLVVGSDETVSSVSGVYGSIVVKGTVTGDVSGVAGDVTIREGGVVEGNIDAAAGSIRISGTVQGDVSTGTGSIHVTDTGLVEGDFKVGAGRVRIDGSINGDAEIGADTIRLGEKATIDGSLTYNGDLQGNRAAVQGDITRDPSLGGGLFEFVLPIGSFIFTVNAFILNFLLGALLLAVFPNFSASVADRVATRPARTGLVGLGVFLGVPLVLTLVAITVIGIPISIAGILLFLVISWIGLVYGRFAVGAWLLSLADVDNRWAALVVGLLLGVALWQIPVLGGIINLVIYLLGLGALVLGLVSHRRRATTAEPAPPEGSPADGISDW